MNRKRLTNMVHWTSITYLSNERIINMLNFSYNEKVKVSQVFLKKVLEQFKEYFGQSMRHLSAYFFLESNFSIDIFLFLF